MKRQTTAANAVKRFELRLRPASKYFWAGVSPALEYEKIRCKREADRTLAGDSVTLAEAWAAVPGIQNA